jgi:hypothetical protein
MNHGPAIDDLEVAVSYWKRMQCEHEDAAQDQDLYPGLDHAATVKAMAKRIASIEATIKFLEAHHEQ